MNKTDRLLAIVLELQRKGRQRAEDLAKIFETSKRTIYRDILTLMIRQPGEILQWLLSWGRHVRVLEPDTLRDHLAEEARTMLQNYQNVSSPIK